MKKIVIVFLIGILCCFGLCACTDKDGGQTKTQAEETKKQTDASLVGTWKEYGIPEERQLGDYWEFKSNGTGVNGLMDMTFKYTISDVVLEISYDEGWGEYKYNYSIDGDILTLQEEGNSANQYQKQ